MGSGPRVLSPHAGCLEQTGGHSVSLSEPAWGRGARSVSICAEVKEEENGRGRVMG